MNLKAPGVYLGRDRSTTIVVQVTDRFVHHVPMSTSGFELVETPRSKFEDLFIQEYTEKTPKQAAHSYFRFAKELGISAAARSQLDKIIVDAGGLADPSHLSLPPANSIKESKMATKKLKDDGSKPPVSTEKNPIRKELEAKETRGKKAAPATEAKETKGKKAAPATEAKGKVEKAEKTEKPAKVNVGSIIQDMLLGGKETEEILMAVREQFPDSKAKNTDVSWYRSKLRREGKLKD